eukprot:120855_1
MPHNERQQISNFYCFFTTWKSSVGAGAYAIPYLFYEASPLLGIVIFSLTVIVTCYTCLIMVDAHNAILSNQSNSNNIQYTAKNAQKNRIIHDDTVLISYADVAQTILGSLGYYLSFWSTVIGMWGSLTAYIIFLKQNLYTFIVDNHSNINFNQILIPIILFPLLSILLLFRNLKKLSIVNILGILSLLIVIIIVFIHSFQHEHIWSDKNIKDTFWRLPTFNSMIIAFGISSFCMEGLIVCS